MFSAGNYKTELLAKHSNITALLPLEKNPTYILPVDKPDFGMDHHVLLSFTLNYKCRICWAQCNPLVFTTKRGGPNSGVGSPSILCFLFIT